MRDIMLSNFDYLWKRLFVCVCVCVNSTFGRCCHCPCWKNDGQEQFDDKEKNANEETLFFKISQNTDVNTIKQCINNDWYDEHSDRVVVLEHVSSAGEEDALSVTGQKDKWGITYAGEKFFKYSNCDSSKNTWVIVEIKLKVDSGPVFLYVDICNEVGKKKKSKEGPQWFNVFSCVELWSLKILAANTQAVTIFSYFFSNAQFGLEKSFENGYKNMSGLGGLERLNVSSCNALRSMFFQAIYKQATINSLKNWRFHQQYVNIDFLFSSNDSESKNVLDFSVLDGWKTVQGPKFIFGLNGSTSVFYRDDWSLLGAPFPSWYSKFIIK